ncbi:MAG: hypothetical protein Q8922_12305 [Bacteroidota bacterium]|nr:hypothetical protein [Bacteroidota bacterium]
MKLFVRLFLTLAALLIAEPFLRAQTSSGTVQWASEVLGVSSEIHKPGEKGYGAEQVLGKPNKCPAVGDSPCAWLPGNDADVGNQEEWIKVGFERPMKITQVAVAENFYPDAISKIVLYDERDRERESYPSTPESAGLTERVHHLIINRTTYNVAAVKIVLQPGLVAGPNEIDAIGIADSWTKI